MTISSSVLLGGIFLEPDIHANRPASALGGALFPCTTHSTVDIYTPGVGWSTWITFTTGGALDDSDIAPLGPNDQTANYTAVLSDMFCVVRLSTAGASTFTIPPNSGVAFPVGTVLQVIQEGAGQVTVTEGAGVTFRKPHGAKTAEQYAVVTAYKGATNTWYISGDVAT